jgi:hypothetical protein
MLIVGTRLFGKVDHVPGHFYVATRFAHVGFFPLVPTGSWLVEDGSQTSRKSGSSWRGWQLPRIHWGSVRMAWLRSGLAVAALVAAGAALLDRADPAARTGALAVVASAAAGFVYSSRLGRASVERVRELCRELGLPPEQAAALRRVASGR